MQTTGELFIEERGWMILRRMILNGNTKGDDKEEYTVTRGDKMHGCILHIKG